jgi:putative membrane protein
MEFCGRPHDGSPLAGIYCQNVPDPSDFFFNLGFKMIGFPQKLSRPSADWKGYDMTQLLIHWLVTALAVWITSRYVRGFFVDGAAAALIAAVVIGLVNATLGLFLKIITFPLTIITLGIFWLIINALMLKLASMFAPAFIFADLPRRSGVRSCSAW